MPEASYQSREEPCEILKGLQWGNHAWSYVALLVCHVAVFIVLIKTLQASGLVQKLFVILNDVPVLTKSWYDGCNWNQMR